MVHADDYWNVSVLPYVANALKQIPWTLLSIMMLAVYVYLFIVPSVNSYQSMLQIPSNEMVYTQVDLSYGGSTYGLYLILGYAIARCKKLLCEKKYRIAMIFTILMGGGTRGQCTRNWRTSLRESRGRYGIITI